LIRVSHHAFDLTGNVARSCVDRWLMRERISQVLEKQWDTVIVSISSNKPMAKLSEQTLSSLFDLQRKLVIGIDSATASEADFLAQFGETDATLSDLDQLQNVRLRLTDPYSRLCTLLLRVAEFQPIAPAVMLNLLAQTIEEGQAAVDAAQASVLEIRRDWDL
jgi:hypothetical protein